MSTRRTQAFDFLRAAAPVCALIAIVAGVTAGLAVLSACESGCLENQQTGSDLDPAFLTPVGGAQEAGLTVYWLGASFEVGDVLFSTREADFPKGIMGVPLQGLELRYSSGDQPGGVLYLDLFSRSDWDEVEEKIRDLRIPGETQPVRREKVQVKDNTADLLFLPLGTRAVNQLWLVLDLGDTVVVALALSVGSTEPGGPDYNPFINNPDLLIQVMEDLRPYPQ